MSFTGTYELQSHENFEPLFKAAGLPDDVIQAIKDLKSVTQMEQNGNHFVVTVTTGSSVLRSEFTIGEETELDSIFGEKIRTTVNIVDGKMVTKLRDLTSISEVSGDLLINVMTLKDVVYKGVSKRIA